MTYNVRRCTGIDGRVSPERVAAVIAAAAPDVVALQEVDVNRKRTNHVDQPRRLAELTGMKAVFFPRLTDGAEQYGIAVLSKHPMDVVKSDGLPTQYNPPKKEKAGAIWVRIQFEGKPLHFIATHFDHHRKERLTHIRSLVGSSWVKDPRCDGPLVLCGDLNTTHRSDVYTQVRDVLNDAQERMGKYQKTWPSFFPLCRIDHIFVSKSVSVASIVSPRTIQTRLASDHLPLIADLTF